MEDEVLQQEVIEQEPVAEEEVNETPENVNFEEPEVNENVEPEQEQPVAEPESEPVVEPEPEPVVEEPQPEPINVRTGGAWVNIEEFTQQEFEVGKTYHIKVQGNCEFMISETTPTTGMKTNEITFTKQEGLALWIKTGV